MVLLTLIARVSDGLPLAEGLETDKNPQIEQYKSQAKSLFKRFAQQQARPAKLSVDSNQFLFHIVIEGGVCFLTLAEKGYPKQLAFQYLEELAGEFGRLYGQQVHTVTRPYAFIKFDTFIQKTKKLYSDTRTQRNLAKLNEDLAEVHSIMTKNIQEVLGQGEKLDGMMQMSSRLRDESKQYSKGAKDLHRQALMKKYMPIAVVVVVILLVLWVRYYFY